MKPKKDVFQEKPLTPAEEHYSLVVDLLELKKAERVGPEEETEIRGWIKELWGKLSAEEQATARDNANILREKYKIL